MKMHACVVALLCLSCALASGSMNAQRNFYDVLNVEPTATPSQIKKVFRSLALKYHPDKNKSAEAEERFREIAQAYKVLSSPEERKLYDHLGHDAFLKNSSGARHEEPNFNDIFHFFETDFFEMDTEFMWTFTDNVVFERFIFHNHEFSFSDSEEFEENIHF